MPGGVSQELARFITSVRLEDLPAPVVDRARELILDDLGVQLAASTLPWSQAVYRYVRDMKVPGKVPVVNFGLRTHPEFAALANATFAHGFELDDWYPPAPAHPGCVAVPVALALAEETGGGGREALLATVIGYEVILRIALAAGKSFGNDRGIHETSAEGVFGAVAIAARMLRLSEAETIDALGLAASHACGVLEFTKTGGEVKRYHAGLAAASGIRSALLAQRGLTAPPTAIEGPRGVLQALANSFDPARLTEGLGKEYLIFGVAIKVNASGAVLHPALEGVTTLMKNHGLTAGDIEDIELGMHKGAIWRVGSIGPRAKDATEAQMSAHFTIALTVVKGSNSFAVYREQMEQGFNDPEVLAVAARVRVVLDEAAERAYPKVRQVRVTIRTRDGRSLTELVVGCKGMPDNPLSREELEGKFRSLASVVLPARRVEHVIKTVAELDKLSDIRELTRLLLARSS